MSPKPNNFIRFWQELKRRKVIRVIPVYAAASFVLLELVDIIAEPLGLPGWTINFVLVILCIGFIISIILSWVYDVTPEGVKKTKPISKVTEQKNEIPAKLIDWKIATYFSVVIIIGLLIVKSGETSAGSPAYFTGWYYSGIGEVDSAIHYLEKAYDEYMEGMKK